MLAVVVVSLGLHLPLRPYASRVLSRAALPRAAAKDASDAPEGGTAGDGGDGLDMDALYGRIERARVAAEPETVHVLILDSMVPGQRLSFTAPDQLVQAIKDNDGKPLCMFGRERLQVFTHGVEVRVCRCDTRDDGDADVELVAGRVCELAALGDDKGSLWKGRPGTVRWVTLDSDEPDDLPSEACHRQSAQLDALVERWLELVRTTGRERSDGQLDAVLSDLGDMPQGINAKALWVAGLINPLPALGVALEVRPAALMAPSTEQRLQAVFMGIVDSIGRLGNAGPPF